MKNREIANILYEIADYLDIQDEQYKPQAYRIAGRNIESLSEDIECVYERGELEEIEGVGESIAEKIREYLETGKLEYYEDLKTALPIDIDAITSVEGVGPKTAKRLYFELGVATLEDLERAARDGKIAELEGFGERSQQNILDHIPLAKQGQERMLLGRAFPIAQQIETQLRESAPFRRVAIVGSFRRRRPTVGDIDILATAYDTADAMELFCTSENVKRVLVRGNTKSSVITDGDLQMDLRLVNDAEYGSALVYFTGSKAHNITLRNRAIERDWKLNEYGLFDVSGVENPLSGQRVGELIASETEEDIYRALGLDWIPPELREDTGEIAAAAAGALPNLIESDDIRGDLQIHTDYSDGSHSVREMAEAADERGLEYILISDHGPGAPIPSKVDAESFEQQGAEIDRLNSDDDVLVTVLQGIEAEITEDGLDISADWCRKCELVVAALHSRPNDPTRLIRETLEDSSVDILAHPSNRLLNQREPLEIAWDSIIETAVDEGVAIEINAQPARLDLDWELVQQYRDTVDFVISTDAHTTGELDHMHLGVSQARRGWCEASDVLNTRPLENLRSIFNS
ncbi:helix-hairpin-helix domain-containing protein (plasmid) [Haloarcula marismortui]|uniref:helix-hairpin-helix domain-containing protein n=1 Tax=Haloarcula marismortui TaxID=2238 RepID=UPI003C76689F